MWLIALFLAVAAAALALLSHGLRRVAAELDDDGHRRLLEALRAVDGMVVLCGYATNLYDLELQGWDRHEIAARISGGRGTTMRTEIVWLNPACSSALASSRGGLFAEVAG